MVRRSVDAVFLDIALKTKKNHSFFVVVDRTVCRIKLLQIKQCLT